ncbi:MAG: hypothetical protein E3J87_09870 [Candidatus Cloacimonadota bacterium]|nr:MAG: hypothetical protein E3J87_09870 [Candidatus Cloacimonadota bacterium]
MKRLSFFILLFVLSCSKAYIKTEVGPEDKVVKLENITFNFPKGAVLESTTIEIRKITEGARSFREGYRTLKLSFSIKPETLVFEKPVLVSFPAKNNQERLAVKLENGYLPIANSRLENGTLVTHIYHAGNYRLIELPEKYGILNSSKTNEALLLISDLHTGHYLENFRGYLKKEGYNLPIWTFIYSNEQSIEDNAVFLAKELEHLHKEYGEFRLDVVGFGIGGLISHRYIADATLYQGDISPAIIAVGTPFLGSNFANIDSVKKGESPFRFFFIDGMEEHAKDLVLESDFISWVRKNRLVGWRHKKLEENKNFASIRGKKEFDGEFPEEFDGDGLVSLTSTMLTSLEPLPFHLSHFELFDNKDVYGVIKDFVQLYHSFNWPLLFTKVWKGEEEFFKISEIWEKEINLHFRSPINLQLLLDFNENLLLSVPQNGILITNGDNDTYPGWYLQGKGIRKDVLIVNWSLLNVTENSLFLKENGLPIPLDEEEIRELKPIKKKSGEIIFVADSLIKILVKNKKRPVVFATTVSHSRTKEYSLRLRGLVLEFGEGDVEIERTRELFHSTFKLKTLFSASPESLNIGCKKMMSNYRATLFALINVLVNEERYDEALEEIQFAQNFPPSPYAINQIAFHCIEASIYYKLNEIEKGDETLKKALDIEKNSTIIKKVAEKYYENERKEEAIKVLAGWLEEHPDDKDILEQLIKYGEE